MKRKLVQSLLSSALAAGLLLSPLPVWGPDAVSAASTTTKATTAAAVSNVQVYVDDAKLALSAAAYAENGVTFVPMRDIFTALGASVTWEGKTGTIIGRKDNTTVSLIVGKKQAVINGKTVNLDAAPVVRKGVTFVPVRFISEALYATVKWDAAAGAVRITSADAAAEAEYEDWFEANKNDLVKLSPDEIVAAYDESVVLIMTNLGQGSGIVIGDNLILTNYHVIQEAASGIAMTVDGAQLSIAGVVHYDTNRDLAIIKTEGSIGAPAVELGYDLNTHKGDKVLAIGSPRGLQNTVSDGLVSNITYEGGVRYLQISVPIDHGSSGGALFNEYGELIGITTLGYTGVNADLNFAVSVRYAALMFDEVTEEMIAKAAFLPSSLPKTLTGAPAADIEKMMTEHYSAVSTSEGTASFTNWKAVRDGEGWLVLSANIDPIFYMYYGPGTSQELRIWAINLGYKLNSLLPGQKIQVLISYEREFGFNPRGFADDEVTSIGEDKWLVRYPVIDMQLKDQLHITVRD